MSYWDHAKPIRRARSVDIEELASAAASLLDQGGIKAVTMRAVAARVNVAAASLYSRVESVDDLFDLALDHTLAADSDVDEAIRAAALPELLSALYRHLTRHRWTCHVIGVRAPRGPAYLRLSERLLVLLEEQGTPDPLGSAYVLSNYVIGCALTEAMADDERASSIDASIAPRYARLHAEQPIDAEAVFLDGLTTLTDRLTGGASRK